MLGEVPAVLDDRERGSERHAALEAHLDELGPRVRIVHRDPGAEGEGERGAVQEVRRPASTNWWPSASSSIWATGTAPFASGSSMMTARMSGGIFSPSSATSLTHILMKCTRSAGPAPAPALPPRWWGRSGRRR